MRALRTLTLKRKLLGAFAAITILGALAGLWNLSNFRWAAGAFQIATRQHLPAIDQLAEADRDMQQALVAERSLMFLRQGSEEAAAMRKAHAEKLADVRSRWGRYSAIPASEGERKPATEFEAALGDWEKLSREIVGLLAQDTGDARKDAIDLSLGEGAAKFEKARAVLSRLTEARLAGAGAFAEQVQRAADRTLPLTIVVLLALAGISGAAGLALARQIVRALTQVVSGAEQAATGDLTVRTAIDTADELGQMGRALNGMLERFAASMAQVQEAARQATQAAQELSAASGQLSSGAQAQASGLEETAASLEEMTATVKQNAENAQQAAQVARAARDGAEAGGAVVRDVVAAMDGIAHSSKRIAAIIGTIDEIAFQTNLLALNAAVEAARAGEQGRGFAVVAAEVRSLAQRSAGASKEIKALIGDSVAKVEGGARLVTQAGTTLTQIVAEVKKVSDLIEEIAAASQEQAQGIDQVNRAVAQMDDVTQQNSAQTEELSSTAQELAAQAGELHRLVGSFRLTAAPDAAAGPAKVVPIPSAAAARALKVPA